MNAQNKKNQKKAFSKPQSLKITTTALLCAIAVVLQYAEVPLPFMPSFIKLDFSDLPELIGAFVCGPLAGVLIAFIKNLFHLIASGSGAVGIVSLPCNNFIIYPLYYSVIGFPKEAILEMYRLIRPSTASIPEALLVFNVPFTIVKGLISVAVTAAVYKPLEKLTNRMR